MNKGIEHLVKSLREKVTADWKLTSSRESQTSTARTATDYSVIMIPTTAIANLSLQSTTNTSIPSLEDTRWSMTKLRTISCRW